MSAVCVSRALQAEVLVVGVWKKSQAFSPGRVSAEEAPSEESSTAAQGWGCSCPRSLLSAVTGWALHREVLIPSAGRTVCTQLSAVFWGGCSSGEAVITQGWKGILISALM